MASQTKEIKVIKFNRNGKEKEMEVEITRNEQQNTKWTTIKRTDGKKFYGVDNGYYQEERNAITSVNGGKAIVTDIDGI